MSILVASIGAQASVCLSLLAPMQLSITKPAKRSTRRGCTMFFGQVAEMRGRMRTGSTKQGILKLLSLSLSGHDGEAIDVWAVFTEALPILELAV